MTTMQRNEIETKPPASHLEEVEMSSEKVDASQGDYSGAQAKTDPEEIALVRKLDWHIMPIIWAMYFLNYVSPLARLLDVSPVYSWFSARSKRHCSGPTEWP